MTEPPNIYVDLPRDNFIEIRLKRKVSRKEFAILKRLFDLAEISLVEDEEPPSPGECIVVEPSAPEDS